MVTTSASNSTSPPPPPLRLAPNFGCECCCCSTNIAFSCGDVDDAVEETVRKDVSGVLFVMRVVLLVGDEDNDDAAEASRAASSSSSFAAAWAADGVEIQVLVFRISDCSRSLKLPKVTSKASLPRPVGTRVRSMSPVYFGIASSTRPQSSMLSMLFLLLFVIGVVVLDFLLPGICRDTILCVMESVQQ